MQVEEGARFGLFLAALDVDAVGVAAPLVVLVGALFDGFGSGGAHVICAKVAGAAVGFPVLVSTAVATVNFCGWVIAQPVVLTLPGIGAAC